MQGEQVELVRSSFAKVAPIAPTAAALFYGKLFELDPNLRFLFRGDMQEQGRKLMGMIATVVGQLDRLETITPAIHNLAQRHVRYGLTEGHYETVGAALLWTLQQGLGADFTPAVREAWAACYGTLSAEMKQAARTSAAA